MTENVKSVKVEPMFEQQFRAARQTSTPIIAIETPDPAATIDRVLAVKRKNGKDLVIKNDVPILVWDVVSGLRGRNSAGKSAIGMLGCDQRATVSIVETLIAAERLPDHAVLFMMNGHLHVRVDQPPVLQGLWNLRDQFKANQRTVILLGVSFQLPAEIAGDVIVIDEPLPTRKELEIVLDMQHENAHVDKPVEQNVVIVTIAAAIGTALAPRVGLAAPSSKRWLLVRLCQIRSCTVRSSSIHFR